MTAALWHTPAMGALGLATRRVRTDHHLVVGEDGISAGRAALRSGDWSAARDAFAAALERAPSGEALDGFGQALWWLKEPVAAIDARTQAYAAFRREGNMGKAARIAVWVSREHRALFRNDAVADGWLARARSAAGKGGGGVARGWVALAEAEASADAMHGMARARDAVEAARDSGDADLEIVALARLGVLQVSIGDVEEGVAHLDEAMAAATAGEGRDPQSVGEASCALMDVAAALGDSDRFVRWAGVIDSFRGSHDYAPLAMYGRNMIGGALSAFCSSCCAGVFVVTGRLDDAEAELHDAISQLEAGGMHSRCVHPVTQLAELRVLQGRLEEAAALLRDYEDLAECVRPLAVLDMAQGAPSAAAERLSARIEQLGRRHVSALPLWALLVDAHLDRGDIGAASSAADEVARIAALTGSERHGAEAAFTGAKVAAAKGDADAPMLLRAAARRLADASLPLSACRARMTYAHTMVERDRAVAIAEARGAVTTFERLGARADADSAAAFLRHLGVKGRTGPKDVGMLTKREVDVLRLLAEGLSNADIADRLFISVKTAGHHVSSILTKLGLRSRTEAAAYAALNLPRDTARK